MPKRIAIDIDGILTIETEGHDYGTRTPNHANIQKVNALHKAGNYIILYTARWVEDSAVTVDWLEKHGVKYDSLVPGKLSYDILIDDKARNSFEGL